MQMSCGHESIGLRFTTQWISDEYLNSKDSNLKFSALVVVAESLLRIYCIRIFAKGQVHTYFLCKMPGASNLLQDGYACLIVIVKR